MESWNQTSTDAVRSHAPDEVNQRIDEQVERCVRYMAQRDRAEISRYLQKLEKEWDIHRAVLGGGRAGGPGRARPGPGDGAAGACSAGWPRGCCSSTGCRLRPAWRTGARLGRRAHPPGD